MEYVVDRSTVKQGKFTPGTHLKIHSPEKLIDDRPDYVLLLTWNFADEILAQSGGRADRAYFERLAAEAPATVDPWRILSRARGVFLADREHIHHNLLELGLSHRTAVVTLYGSEKFEKDHSRLLESATNLFQSAIHLSGGERVSTHAHEETVAQKSKFH